MLTRSTFRPSWTVVHSHVCVLEQVSPVGSSYFASNKSQIEIYGALLVCLSGTSKTGEELFCRTMVYISPNADGFYVSLEAMVDLGLINRGSALFPITSKWVHSRGRQSVSLLISWQRVNLGLLKVHNAHVLHVVRHQIAQGLALWSKAWEHTSDEEVVARHFQCHHI